MKQIESAIKMNKQGVAYFAQQDFERAIQAFQAAIDEQPDYTDAYYNLGLALTKAQRRQEAMNAYEALIALMPQHWEGRFQLGCLWMQRNNYKMALEYFLAVEKIHSQHIETLMNVAACYLRLGYLNESKSYYLKVLEITPDETQALFNLGVINMQQGRIKDAIVSYSQALKVHPDFFSAHNNLAVAYLGLSDSAAALLHFRAALRIAPHNEAVRHTVDILTREKKLSASPPEYIRSLFDSYAEHYDLHLQGPLHYEVPKHLLEMVLSEKPTTLMTVLDLGCGTGLTGEVFKPYACKLVGVDLSKNMLAQAAQKNIYSELIESDLLPFLVGQKEKYDLLVAGDVFVYFGAVADLFSAISKVLKPGGLLTFNAEISQKENYLMTYSGRFAHLKGYLDQIAADNHLQLVRYEMTTMRTQDEVAVPGHFYLLRKLC